MAQGRSYPRHITVFLDQGSNPRPCIDSEFLTPEPPGKSQYSNLLHFISESQKLESFCHSPYPIHHRFYELCLQSISSILTIHQHLHQYHLSNVSHPNDYSNNCPLVSTLLFTTPKSPQTARVTFLLIRSYHCHT